MPISTGDAVMNFLANQEQLDRAFQQIPGKAEKAFGAASKFNQNFQDDLDATGDNVKFAGEKILSLTDAFRTLSIQGPDRLKQKLDDAKNAFATLQSAGVTAKGTLLQATAKVTEREIAYRQALGDSTADLQKQLANLTTQYAKLGGIVEEPGKKITSGFREARGSVDLLADGIGLRIPRELKALLSTLPGVSAALEAAFIPVAAAALIGLLAELIVKFTEYQEKQRLIKAGWEEYARTVAETSIQIVSQIKAQEQELIAMTQGPVAALAFALKNLETTALTTFKSISSGIESAVRVMGEQAGFTNTFKEAKNDLSSFRDALFDTMRAAKEASPGNPLAAYEAGLQAVNQKAQEVQKHIEFLKNPAVSGADTSAVTAAYEKELLVLRDVAAALREGKQLDQDRVSLAKQSLTNAGAEQAAKSAHDALEAQLADIEKFKASQHAGFVTGQTDAASWAVAQLRATDAASLAQESYLQRLIVIYGRAGDVIKQQQAIQDLATLKIQDSAKGVDTLAAAMQAHHAAALKMSQDWANLLNQNIDKEWQAAAKAAQELVKAEERLHEAQTRLQQLQTARNFSAQIQDIQELASLQIISQSDAASSLRAIYQQQEADQRRHLDALLAQQEEVASVASQRIDQAKDNPFFSDAQRINLQKNLDEANTSIANTQAQIETLGAASEQRWAQFTATIRANEKEIAIWQRLAKTGTDQAGLAMLHLRDRAKQSLDVVSGALQNAIAQAILGQKSFGVAIAQALAQTLAAWAAEDAIHALRAVALGFYNLAIHDYTGAASAFHSAALYGAVAAGEGVAAFGFAQVGKEGNQGSPNAPTNLPATPATTAGGGSGGPNVPRLAVGGLVSRPTLVIIGDSVRAGSAGAREAVIPLDDPRAMSAIAGAIADRLSADYSRSDIAVPAPPDFESAIRAFFGGGNSALANGIIQNHYYIKGDVIDHAKLIQKQSRMIKKGRARAVASEALRVTKRA